MEHLTYEFDRRGLVGILFVKLKSKTESSVFKWRIGRSYNHCVPGCVSIVVASCLSPTSGLVDLRLDWCPKYIPSHDIIWQWWRWHSARGILLHTLEVVSISCGSLWCRNTYSEITHESSFSWCGHFVCIIRWLEIVFKGVVFTSSVWRLLLVWWLGTSKIYWLNPVLVSMKYCHR